MINQPTIAVPGYETKIEADLGKDRQALAHPFKVERSCEHRSRIPEQNNPSLSTGRFYCPECETLFQI